MPPRMVAFDTESRSHDEENVEVQEWRVGCAIRWRTDTKASDHREARVFDTPDAFWSWVSDFCRKGTRTVVWAHNLGYDVRISRMFDILPGLGFHLEWCNLDRNISSATWRSDHGTIVLADTWTWIPLPLKVIAGECGMVKYDMPSDRAPDESWARYCMQDTEILYRVVSELMAFITSEGLGNWQPTGAGMAYATWRHKFLTDKVLVHDDVGALEAERIAMHTGRAEAWRHGEVTKGKWTEVDFQNAYLRIAAEIEVPRKLHMVCPSLSMGQFRRLRDRFAILARVTITTSVPVVPTRINQRHVWPVGTFDTWLWDNELGVALRYGAEVKIHESYVYVKAPVLQGWGRWVLDVLHDDSGRYSGIVRTHIKHCSRAFIGRLALRTPTWEYFGTNIDGYTGITHVWLTDEKRETRFLHVGQDTLIETAREEGKDSLPMITGYIMAEQRCREWELMNAAGLENLAHVDTDSVLCNSTGLSRIREHYGDRFTSTLTIKGTFTRLLVYGPRSYYQGKTRKTSGIPAKASENPDGSFSGERWSSLSTDLADGYAGAVRVHGATWHLAKTDPRRGEAVGGQGFTRAYDAGELSSANGSSAGTSTVGQ